LPRCRQPIGNRRATRGTFISRSNTVFATIKIQHNRIQPKRPIKPNKTPEKNKNPLCWFFKTTLVSANPEQCAQAILKFSGNRKTEKTGIAFPFPHVHPTK
jgi:hypothetical protein